MEKESIHPKSFNQLRLIKGHQSLKKWSCKIKLENPATSTLRKDDLFRGLWRRNYF